MLTDDNCSPIRRGHGRVAHDRARFGEELRGPDQEPGHHHHRARQLEDPEIEFGYSARPQDESVFFSVEFASARNIDKMMATNDAWMKENKIKKVEPIKAEAPLNGISATIFQYRTTDENGPTMVDFILLPAGESRVIMLTVWGSDEEREGHGKELDAIFGSIKSIN